MSSIIYATLGFYGSYIRIWGRKKYIFKAQTEQNLQFGVVAENY